MKESMCRVAALLAAQQLPRIDTSEGSPFDFEAGSCCRPAGHERIWVVNDSAFLFVDSQRPATLRQPLVVTEDIFAC